MAKNVFNLNYEKIYDEIPYHIKCSANLPLSYNDLSYDQINFLNSFLSSTETVVRKAFDEEVSNMTSLAEEMRLACESLLNEVK